MGTILHDLRQPLSVIGLCTDYLKLILPSNQEPARQHLVMMQQQLDHASRILGDAMRLLEADQRERAAESSRSLTNVESATVTY